MTLRTTSDVQFHPESTSIRFDHGKKLLLRRQRRSFSAADPNSSVQMTNRFC
jgi:hypothetical protein